MNRRFQQRTALVSNIQGNTTALYIHHNSSEKVNGKETNLEAEATTNMQAR